MRLFDIWKRPRFEVAVAVHQHIGFKRLVFCKGGVFDFRQFSPRILTVVLRAAPNTLGIRHQRGHYRVLPIDVHLLAHVVVRPVTQNAAQGQIGTLRHTARLLHEGAQGSAKRIHVIDVIGLGIDVAHTAHGACRTSPELRDHVVVGQITGTPHQDVLAAPTNQLHHVRHKAPVAHPNLVRADMEMR